ncbi:leucine-rich repeat flightless-interacting protein 1 isoform X2 [Artibeus jamaicensis]|uniref:leucine-rich repeat flightless-interacting protein 1 isoform X2 n=1 Tax=Artibeus jamaicensis TaxID=9417 RepID=UPI00235B0786|nr:leucine-rich repeat flightless-interacting protein 1 isoform X2 [Artibeus jamaicensis]
MTNPATAQNKEIDCLSPEAQRLAEARLAAKRAARAEAREIRMKELERQQKEIYQVQKKYYGLETKWGDIEQWMEDSERYSRRSRRSVSASDEDERLSVGSRGSLRVRARATESAWTNGYDGDLYGSQSLSRRSGRSCSYSGDGRPSTLSASREEKLPSCLYSAAGPSSGSYRSHFTLESLSKHQAPAWDGSSLGGVRRGSACGVQAPSEHSGYLSSSSRASSRASSARASPVVEERPEKDFTEKGPRNLPGLSAATLASLGGTSARRGSGDTSVSVDTEASMREIKELHELKDQIQDVEGKYMQGLKEMKDSLAEVEEKYKKAMVSNAQLDNEKTNYMYQVDTLKDTLLGLEEQLAECRRQYEEKSKEFEREKHAHGLLRFQLAEMKAALQQREELLQEIRQLQQKQASYVREISDLQETIEWKDRKIGALERQKEFFDSIRSEREDLREEVGLLKEALKKHGIILNSEVAANGETPDTLTSPRHQGPTRTTGEEPNALQAAGDGPLGKATEVEVKTVDSVGHREISQSAGREQHREDPVEDGADTEVLPPGGRAEDQRPSDDSALSLATVANATDEDQVQSQVLANMSVLEHAERGVSSEVTSAPDAGAGASECLRELDGDLLGPEAERGGGGASDPLNQSRESAETQEREKQGCGTSLGEASPEPHQESAPSQISEVDQASGSQSSAQAGPTGSGGPEGTVASRPPRGGVDTGSQDDRSVADVPREVGASVGCGSETELTNQEAAEPGAAPAQSPAPGVCGEEGEAEGAGVTNERPTQTEVQTGPSSVVATHHVQEATGPRTADAKGKPLDAKEPGEDSNDLQGEGLDSPQKKTKNKKKKNKKRKSAGPAETSKDAKEELPPQGPGLSEVKEEEPERFADERPGVGTPEEAPAGPRRNSNSVAGSSKNLDVLESAAVEVDGKRNPGGGDTDAELGRAGTDGEPAQPDGDAVRASGSRAGAGGSEEGGGTNGDGAAPCWPPGDEGVPHSTLPGGQRPSGVVNGENQGVREASESLSPESDGVAPREEAGGQSEKDKSKEDCTLS